MSELHRARPQSPRLLAPLDGHVGWGTDGEDQLRRQASALLESGALLGSSSLPTVATSTLGSAPEELQRLLLQEMAAGLGGGDEGVVVTEELVEGVARENAAAAATKRRSGAKGKGKGDDDVGLGGRGGVKCGGKAAPPCPPRKKAPACAAPAAPLTCAEKRRAVTAAGGTRGGRGEGGSGHHHASASITCVQHVRCIPRAPLGPPVTPHPPCPSRPVPPPAAGADRSLARPAPRRRPRRRHADAPAARPR